MISNQDYIQELENELAAIRKVKSAFEVHLEAMYGYFGDWCSHFDDGTMTWLTESRNEYERCNNEYKENYGR